MALRMPISRVRSFTDMVMVLTTESPPTRSEMMAMPKMMALKIFVALAIWLLEGLGPVGFDARHLLLDAWPRALGVGALAAGRRRSRWPDGSGLTWLRTTSGRSLTYRLPGRREGIIDGVVGGGQGLVHDADDLELLARGP